MVQEGADDFILSYSYNCVVFVDLLSVISLLWHVLGIDDGFADVTNIHHAQDDECS